MNDSSIPGVDEGVWNRLRRRKVVQWSIAYVAGAWVVLQGLEFLAGVYDWQHGVLKVATLAIALGLPIAVTLAWYHGDRGRQRVSGTELAIVAVLFLLGGGAVWYYQRTAAATSAAPAIEKAVPTDASIAVLPFVNMSSDKEQEYLADGISEELLNLLAQVPGFRVIARTSSFSFKGKDAEIAEIAQRLNVANVLEGSVRKSGDKLRITAQLVRASDSSDLWSQTYDRQLSDVFEVQHDIAAAVVAQLKIKLLGSAPKLRATDPHAYALFLQAREVTRQYTPTALGEAISLYRQALAIDATYAPAWDGLAAANVGQMDLGVITIEQGLPLAHDAIGKALALDPEYAPAYGRAAMIEGFIGTDVAAAARYVEQGLARDPADLECIGSAVEIARRLGRLDQAIALAEYLVARDPVNLIGFDSLAFAYFYAGRSDEAIAAFRTVLKLSPGFGSEHTMLGQVMLLKGDTTAALAEIQQEPVEGYRLVGLSMVYHALGRNSESDAALDELITRHGRTLAYNIAAVLAYRGEIDRAFEWLDKAIQHRDSGLGSIALVPMLRNLHSDPRWLPLLRRLGRAPEQLAAIKFDVKVPK